MNTKTVTGFCVLPMLLAGCGGPTPPNWERITAVCSVPAASEAPAGDAAPADATAAGAVPAEGAAAAATTDAQALPDHCTSRVFYLDTANITKQGGVIYVTMRTTAQDASDGSFGIIRAEANCAGQRLEPSALKEDVYDSAGKLLETARLAVITADDQTQVLAKACAD
jgi:hypothetical protein